MADLALQNASAGLEAVDFAAATAGGDTMPVGTTAGNWMLPVVLLVDNKAIAARTVTIAALGIAVEVTASSVAVIPVSRQAYLGRVNITYSDSAADVEVAVVGLAR